MPFSPFLGEGSPTKIDDRKKCTLILSSLLEDLVEAPKSEPVQTAAQLVAGAGGRDGSLQRQQQHQLRSAQLSRHLGCDAGSTTVPSEDEVRLESSWLFGNGSFGL